MSTYLSGTGILLIVLSPVLIPAVITAFHIMANRSRSRNPVASRTTVVAASPVV